MKFNIKTNKEIKESKLKEMYLKRDKNLHDKKTY